MTIRITVRNYRCFTDEFPLSFEWGPGFTAFVGPNNAGKSAALKFLHEFQPVWHHFSDSRKVAELLNAPNDRDFGSPALRDVTDLAEVFSDHSDRPLRIQFDVLAEQSGIHLRDVKMEALHRERLVIRATGSPSQAGHRILQFDGETPVLTTGQRFSVSVLVDFFRTLAGVQYAPAFRNAVNSGGGSLYGMALGTTLVQQWTQWKAGTSKQQKRDIERVTHDMRRILGMRQLEINASADNKTFTVSIDGNPHLLNDIGSGISEFIILFANVATRKPSALLIDEPECHLHPLLQVELLTSLASYTQTGIVVFATHSLGLARSTAERIYSIQKGERGSSMRVFERTAGYAQFAGEMNFAGMQELGCDQLLLVEGATDVKTVTQWLRILGKERHVAVLQLGGRSMITAGRAQELAELGRVSPKVAVLIDSEKNSPDQPLQTDRAAFVSDCETLGFRIHATKRRAIENYLPAEAIRAVKGERFESLEPFEPLGAPTKDWGKAENWMIARRMSRAQIIESDVGEFLNSL
jgi:energy-coupling factor transporter ATP-binding protein EcfA2